LRASFKYWKRSSGLLDEHDRGDFASIRSAIQSVVELNAGVLHHARLINGGVVPRMEEFEFDEVITSCVEVASPIASLKGLLIVHDYKADTMICSDKTMVTQIFNNILTNAIRYTAEGGVAIHTSLRDSCVYVIVQDTGIGMSAADCEHVFDEHYRADAAKLASPGTGLGLTIARRMAEALGGELTLTSELEVGSTVALRLPLEPHPSP
jgi:signal transduction histidine kinase